MISTYGTRLIERCVEGDEGGWVFTNRVNDSGGPTYGGMTWVKFNEWQKKPENTWQHTQSSFIAAATQHRTQLQEAVIQCYVDEFYVRGHVAEVPKFAQAAYFSACVNKGLKEALKCLQMAANNFTDEGCDEKPLLVDGHWGPKTKALLDAVGHDVEYAGQEDVFQLAFSDAAMARYIRIVQRNAREWRDYAVYLSLCYTKEELMHKQPPRVLQTENLMGWWNRAVSYRGEPC